MVLYFLFSLFNPERKNICQEACTSYCCTGQCIETGFICLSMDGFLVLFNTGNILRCAILISNSLTRPLLAANTNFINSCESFG